jgi:hypothetical protein
MKIMKFASLLILFSIMTVYSALSQSTKFNGEWTLNTEKTVLPDNQLYLAKVTVMLKGDSIITARVYQDGMGSEYPFEEKLSLDGKESKITIYDMPRTSKATKSATDGSVLIESSTTFNNNGSEDNLKAIETWKVDAEGKILSVEYSNTMSGTETKGINYYNKVK